MQGPWGTRAESQSQGGRKAGLGGLSAEEVVGGSYLQGGHELFWECMSL